MLDKYSTHDEVNTLNSIKNMMNTTRLKNDMDLLDMSIFAYSIKDESIINDFMKEYYPSFFSTETIVKFIQVFERSTLNNENMKSGNPFIRAAEKNIKSLKSKE